MTNEQFQYLAKLLMDYPNRSSVISYIRKCDKCLGCRYNDGIPHCACNNCEYKKDNFDLRECPYDKKGFLRKMQFEKYRFDWAPLMVYRAETVDPNSIDNIIEYDTFVRLVDENCNCVIKADISSRFDGENDINEQRHKGVWFKEKPLCIVQASMNSIVDSTRRIGFVFRTRLSYEYVKEMCEKKIIEIVREQLFDVRNIVDKLGSIEAWADYEYKKHNETNFL